MRAALTVSGAISPISRIVNAANAALRTGSGVAGAIHRAAGPQLETECRDYAPIMPGEAVIKPSIRIAEPVRNSLSRAGVRGR